MNTFDVIAETKYNTIVAEYTPDAKKSETYQTEADLEAEFIRLLAAQGYGTPKITSEEQLIANLREQLQILNGYTFTESE